jgi:hypothetical protein
VTQQIAHHRIAVEDLFLNPQIKNEQQTFTELFAS